MSLQFTWTGRNEIERIAEIAWQCYASRVEDKQKFLSATHARPMSDNNIVIASRDGIDVGTATAMPLFMHIRGKRVACQGVAWVGTSKAHRRRSGDAPGVASQIMQQVLAMGRSKGQVVSALMPFRVSFYEHFGYGIVEKQNIWTIPLSLIPSGNSLDWRFGKREDAENMIACRTHQVKRGHCDIETDADQLIYWFHKLENDTQFYIGEKNGNVFSYTWISTIAENEKLIANVIQPAWNGSDGFKGLLELLGSLKDQYSFARLALPTDLPVNWLLKERQLPHRLVEHPAPLCKMISRMQVRVLDHAGFLDGQELTRAISGEVTIGITESEGSHSIVRLSIEDGIISAKYVNAQPDIVLNDVTWASIACGELRASTAVELGLTSCREDKLAILDALADGPAPFCFEYF